MKLLPHECYRRIKEVNLGPALRVMDQMEFVDTGGKCALVSRADQKVPHEIRHLIASLKLGGTTKRLFFRKLPPRQGIAPHVDDWIPEEEGWQRFQVPITSDPEIRMRWPDDDVEVHLQPGFLYEVRFDRKHEVVHNADCDRIHMQIDQVDATI